MKPTKCPAKEKKWRKKYETRGEKQKVKVKTAVSVPLNSQIFLSAHAWTSQANILHLDQKEWIVQAVKYGFMV